MTKSKRKRLERRAKRSAKEWINRANNRETRKEKRLSWTYYLEFYRRTYRLIPCIGLCRCFKGQWIVDGVRYPSRSELPAHAEAELKQAEYTASITNVPVFWQDFEDE